MRSSAFSVALVLLLAGATPASAYVPYRTADKAHAFYWPTSCVPITVYLGNFAELPGDQVMTALRAAAHTWSRDAASCTYMDLQIQTGSGEAPHHANDARNILVFRTDRWCKWDDSPTECAYDPAALAVTSVFAKGDGHLIDADIEVNAAMAQIRWMDADVMRVAGKHDLQNAMTHEMGHFLGFDHSCYNPASNKERPLDNAGSAVADCGDTAPADVQATVMYDSTYAGETSKRMLSPDDQKAVCDTYPPSLDPQVCLLNLPDDSCGCTTRPGRSGRPTLDLAAAAAFAGLAWLATARRRLARARSQTRR